MLTPELEPFENTRRDSPAIPRDLTVSGIREFSIDNSDRPVPFLLKDFCNLFPKCFSHYLTTCDTNLRRLLNAPMHKLPVLLFDNFEGVILPEISLNLSLKEDSCMHSLQKILQLLQRIEVLQLYALPIVAVSQQFRSLSTISQVRNL
jgi:hypothetical protein